MLGDVLLITDGHRKAAQGILKHLEEISKKKVILAIGGESGSGKTEIAHVIARSLKERGTPAKIMHIDNYYLTYPQERTPWRQEHGLDSIGYTEYNWDLINKNLDQFQNDSNKVSKPSIYLLREQED